MVGNVRVMHQPRCTGVDVERLEPAQAPPVQVARTLFVRDADTVCVCVCVCV